MPKSKASKTTTNCGSFSLYPSSDGKAWKWFRFNGSKNRGGMKDIATIAKKAGYFIDGPITNLVDARTYVETAIEKGLVNLPGEENKATSSLILRDYVKKMMNPEEALFDWLQGDPETKISLRRFQSYGSSFKCHGYDALPKDLKLKETTQEEIERFVRKLRSSGKVSEEVVNNCLQAVKKTCLYAVKELKAIRKDPTEGVKVSYKSKSKSEMDLLRTHELIQLLTILEQHANEKSKSRLYAKSIYIAVKLMIHTGMREGEVRALKISKIQRVPSDKGEPTKIFRIRVDSSWDDTTKKIKTTKSGKPRDVFIWEDLAQLLIDLYNDVKAPSGLIFCCLTNPSIPLTKNNFTDYVYSALREMGISEEQRKERKIHIHTLRHIFITRSEVLSFMHKDIMTATGHDTESAHSLYMHYSFKNAYRMAKLSRDILKVDDDEEEYKDALLDE